MVATILSMSNFAMIRSFVPLKQVSRNAFKVLGSWSGKGNVVCHTTQFEWRVLLMPKVWHVSSSTMVYQAF